MPEFETSTPRRPIVPGPSGIAAKAIAVREAAREQQQNIRHTPEGSQLSRPEKTVTEMAPQGPTIREALAYRVPGPVGNLAKGIAGVMSECGTITKSGYNKFHNYHYATLQDLLYAVTPLMGRHGVVVIQNEVERSSAESRIMVTYEFSIFHTSGEVWPERPRFTGMSIGRNSKGEYDDKAINKCHSAARKYFLLSLFQVPSGDFDDADEGPAGKPEQPTPKQRATSYEQSKTQERPNTVPGPATLTQQPITDERLPHKIGFTPGMTADKWASEYLILIERAESETEIAQYDAANDTTLQRLSDKYPDTYEQVRAAVERRMAQLAPIASETNGMPDPAKDAQGAMQWVAQNLVDSETYTEAEAFWNVMVAPHEAKFDPADWELLMTEWRRTELRLNPDPPDAD